MAMKFDSTITLGHVVTMFGMLCAGGAAYTSLQVKLTKIESDIAGIQEYKTDQKAMNNKIHERIEKLEYRLRTMEMSSQDAKKRN